MPGVVYVRGDNGKVKKVLFGDPHMRIRKNEAGHRASFRARHHCENPGPKQKPATGRAETGRSRPTRRFSHLFLKEFGRALEVAVQR